MTRTSSALKANRAAQTKTIRNRRRLATIDKLIRQSKRSVPSAPEIAISLQRAIDKAASRGVIHPNRAARMKSRLSKAATSKNGSTTTVTKKITSRRAKKTTKK